jgi:hypothetical protein
MVAHYQELKIKITKYLPWDLSIKKSYLSCIYLVSAGYNINIAVFINVVSFFIDGTLEQ